MTEQNPMDDYFIFDKRIREKYTVLNTKHLNEHDLIAKAIEILRDKLVINPFDYSEFKLLNEIDYLTQEIKYQSAILHILKPGINVHGLLDAVDMMQLGHFHVGNGDCSHYCLPGVPDLTAHSLIEMIHSSTGSSR